MALSLVLKTTGNQIGHRSRPDTMSPPATFDLERLQLNYVKMPTLTLFLSDNKGFALKPIDFQLNLN